jgi:hypothetical protein
LVIGNGAFCSFNKAETGRQFPIRFQNQQRG